MIGKVLVMSTQQPYINCMECGLKVIELRTQPPKLEENKGKRLYFYSGKSSGGSGMVVGYIIFNDMKEICISDKDVMAKATERACVSSDYILKYTNNGEKKIYAIYISNYVKLDKPLPLSYFGIERAPQNWCYGNIVEEKTIKTLINEILTKYPECEIETFYADNKPALLNVFTHGTLPFDVFFIDITNGKINKISEMDYSLKWLYEYWLHEDIFK